MMDDFAVVSDTPQMLPPPPGSFLDREELIQHVGEFGVTQGYIVTIKQSKKDKIVVLGCQRGGVYRNRRKSADEGTGELVRKRKSGSQLTNCPFELVGKKDDDFWVLSVKNGSHNHEPLSDITQHPSARRFTENEVLLIKEMTDAGLKPRQILKRLKQHNPERLSTPKQLYNIKTKIRQGNLTGSARRFKTLRPQTSAQGNPSSSTTSEPSWRQRYPPKVPNFIGGMFIDSQSRTSIDVLSPKIHARTASTSEIHEQPATGIDEYEPDSRDVLSSHTGSHRLGSTSNVVCTPFGHGHARPPSPSIDEYAMDEGTSSHHGYSHRPYGMAVDIQRPRALIDAYGADERNTTTNQNIRHAKNPTINGLSSKVGGQTWQTTEEEEFEWEDMSPTLAGHGHAFGANRSMPRKNDFSRTNWSNQEMLPSVVLNNAVSSSDHGLKRKINALHNEPSDNQALHYPREVWNRSHDQPWATRHNYNPHVPRPSLIDSSNGAWRPSVNMQASQPVPVPIPPHPYKNHTGSSYDMLNATTNSAANDNVPFLRQQFDANENRARNQLPQLPNQQAGFASNQQLPGQGGKFQPQLPLPHDVRPNMVPPPLHYNSSHLNIQPMIRAYTPQRFDAPRSASSNQVPGMQSSMPFHAQGVGFPPLPPGLPPSSLPMASIPQHQSIAPPPPAGGALSGLFSSLVAQGLLSLTKPSPEQASVGLEFDPDVLKNRHESAITALYADLPRQCKTCGLRFKMQEEHSSHMDWHVTKNRVSRNRKQKPSRKWFANVSMWLSSAEALGADAVPGFLLPSENVVEKKDDEELSVPADEDQNACELCGEPFEDFYSDETEEWMYRGAVYMNAPTGSTVGMDRSLLGPIVHAKCRSESTVAPLNDSGNNGQVFIEERMRR